MWASLNHTTCSLNMNYIHLRSMTFRFRFFFCFPPQFVSAFVELLCNAVTQEQDNGLDLNEVIVFDLVNPALRLLRKM